MLCRCSVFSASSRSISAACARSLDWIMVRWRLQELLSDSSRRFIACSCAFRCGALKLVPGAVAVVPRRRRLRFLLAQRVEQKR